MTDEKVEAFPFCLSRDNLRLQRAFRRLFQGSSQTSVRQA